ncbi:MAG: hypothetical protein NZ951_08445 [Dehalococcoidia bacterium]|nr:hypothetical protein [Dehalococcoidia bacterium]MDW8120474.1 hypothetical protein [Chloroflexota bacterium]
MRLAISTTSRRPRGIARGPDYSIAVQCSPWEGGVQGGMGTFLPVFMTLLGAQ